MITVYHAALVSRGVFGESFAVGHDVDIVLASKVTYLQYACDGGVRRFGAVYSPSCATADTEARNATRTFHFR